jgi:glutaredoxin 3
VRQAEVLVYLSRSCFYCLRAKHLLEQKGVHYTSIDAGSDPAMWDEMEARSGRSTVPQIFIDHHPVGGYSDISKLDKLGQLDALLFPTTERTLGAAP